MIRHVLIVAYYFPPTAASGAMRPLGFCRYLRKYGWQPRVLTTDSVSVDPFHSCDVNLLTMVPEGVDVQRVPYVNLFHMAIAYRDRYRTLFRSWLRHQEEEQLPRIDQTAAHGSQSHGNQGRLRDKFIEWAFAFPDPQQPWFKQAVRRAYSVWDKTPPDVVFATGGPWTSLLIGRTLAKKFRVPFIADFRDPWIDNPFYRFRSTFLFEKARKLEHDICMASARVVANTDELRDELIAKYPPLKERCITIHNGYNGDPPLPTIWSNPEPLNEQVEISTEPCRDCILELCHFGTVYHNRDPYPLLQAALELAENEPHLVNQLVLRFVGIWEPTSTRCETLARQLERQGILRRDPPVTHRTCMRQMKKAECLLVLQPNYPLQIPAKIYEYIAAGRPIILLGGEGATANLVRRNRLGFSCRNDVPSIKLLLQDLIAHRINLGAPDPAIISRFDYQTLTGQLAELLDDASTVRATPTIL